jgi:transposase
LDVLKDMLDVEVPGHRRVMQFANTREVIAGLQKVMHQLAPALIVVEATGGYEKAVVKGLFEAAMNLAEFGKHVQPGLFMTKSDLGQRLSALLVRRR